jgi:type I restriction enzyme M protein
VVLKKRKRPDDVLFINAAEHFVKGKRQNRLTDQYIENIITTYQHRKEQDRYARRVSMKEIVQKDYNLNISRYVSTALEEAEVDLAATHAELVRLEGEIAKATAKHNEFLRELGLPLLPSVSLDAS